MGNMAPNPNCCRGIPAPRTISSNPRSRKIHNTRGSISLWTPVRGDVFHELQFSFVSRHYRCPGGVRPEAIAESETGPEAEYDYFDSRDRVQVVFDICCEWGDWAVEVNLVLDGEEESQEPADI